MPYSDISLQIEETPEARLTRLNNELRHASAETILRAAILREWCGSISYVSSFGAESAIMLALIADIEPDLPIFFLETGLHFPQTLDYKDTLTERLGLTNVKLLVPDSTEQMQEDPKQRLWSSDPDACCALRKVRPLESALKSYGAWINGRKRFHGGARLSLPVFEAASGQIKINPLASWGRDDVQAYFKRRDLPQHPLVEQGFPSIGCWPCTQASRDPENVRAGRWSGRDKTECGLHIEKKPRPRVF